VNVSDPNGYDYPKEMVSFREHMGEMGMGAEWFVRLPDGYQVSVGSDRKRAEALARSIHVANVPDYQWSERTASIPF
jgi:hypothetical protein